MMKIEPEIILPYEDLPESNNDYEEENYSPMEMDNYYSDQEYWFEGDD